MALETTLGGDGSLFIGEDKRLRFGPLSEPAGWNTALDGTYVPPDISAWAIQFVVRLKDGSPDPAIIDVAVSGTLGTYATTVATNTQQVYVDLSDTQMNLFSALKDGKTYRWSLKRMDDTLETVLAYGDFIPQQVTAH
jgi:hypothetical protein